MQNMDVHQFSVMSRNSVGSREPWTTSRTVDTFPIQAEPLADFAQTRSLSWLNLAIGAWSHIEQHVAIASCGTDQQLQELRERFHLGIGLVTPGTFRDRCAQLPWMLVVKVAKRRV